MASVISGDANVSAAEFGYLDGVTSALQTQMDAKLAVATAVSDYLPIAGGKILQVVRATDGTERTTSSASFVDVTGMSVTITPQKSTSSIIVLVNVMVRSVETTNQAETQITDSSNNALNGAQQVLTRQEAHLIAQTLIGYSTPATTSATTYKLRFKASGGTAGIRNDLSTGQIYAIEVSA